MKEPKYWVMLDYAYGGEPVYRIYGIKNHYFPDENEDVYWQGNSYKKALEARRWANAEKRVEEGGY